MTFCQHPCRQPSDASPVRATPTCSAASNCGAGRSIPLLNDGFHRLSADGNRTGNIADQTRTVSHLLLLAGREIESNRISATLPRQKPRIRNRDFAAAWRDNKRVGAPFSPLRSAVDGNGRREESVDEGQWTVIDCHLNSSGGIAWIGAHKRWRGILR